VKELPPRDRPRERLAAHGASRLSTVELISILIGSGSRQRSSLALAHDAFVSAGGSLRKIASEPLAVLTAVSGLGKARAAVIHAALELGRRMLQETKQEGETIRSPRDVHRLYAPRLEDLPVEEFHVMVLDAQQRFQRDILVSRGILNSSLVHPREVFREVIAERAASIILVHNHPSGDPNPSIDDRLITDQLVEAGDLLDIMVRDHVVIGRGRYVSFVEAGLFPVTGAPPREVRVPT
jgi:DNA repair protein RadC